LVSDARRLEPLSQQAADLLQVIADPDRLIICCDLIGGAQSVECLEERLSMSRKELNTALQFLVSNDVLETQSNEDKTIYRLADIQAAEIIDALCSAFLGEDFSNRAKIPFRPNKRLVGGYGKFGGANI